MRTKANSLPPLSRSLTRKHMWLNTQPHQGRRTGATACIYNAVRSTSTNTNTNTNVKRTETPWISTRGQQGQQWRAQECQREAIGNKESDPADLKRRMLILQMNIKGFWGSSERPQNAKGAPMEVTMHCYSLVSFLTTLVFV